MLAARDSVIYQNVMGYQSNVEKVCSTWSMLHDCKVHRTQLERCKIVEVSSGDIKFDLVFESLPKEILATLPLLGHQLYDSQTGMGIFVDKCNKAAQIIEMNLSDNQKNLPSYLKVLIPIRLKFGSKEKVITSLTIPDLPFASFFSENAFVHLAPDILQEGFDEYFLSENIVHEMVHNMVNIMLLEGDVLVPNYSSSSSKKIKIPWRINSEIRNQYWELDRVIHAYFVYAHMSVYRMMLSQTPNTGFTRSMVKASLANFYFLRERIIENKSYLTNSGFDFIQSVQNNVLINIL